MDKRKRSYPAELQEQIGDAYFPYPSGPYRKLYLTILIAFSLGFSAIFFIRVDLVLKGAGRITALAEKSWLKAPVSGRISEVRLPEHEPVKKGAVLFRMESALLDQQYAYMRSRRTRLEESLSDLRVLLEYSRRRKVDTLPRLRSALYLQQFHTFRRQAKLAAEQLQNMKDIFERQRQLFGSGVIAPAEYEEHFHRLEKARLDGELVFEEQAGNWEREFHSLRAELDEVEARMKELSKERELYTVRAPLDGAWQGSGKLHPGSFVLQGEEVAEWLPDSGLIARVYIPPGKIGLLYRGMKVRFLVDAFDYRQWGTLEGEIEEIGRDVTMLQEGGFFFEVKCSLKERVLRLGSGYKGRLRKGMTLQAHFMLARRSLFQLLYDHIGNWLDPYGRNQD